MVQNPLNLPACVRSLYPEWTDVLSVRNSVHGRSLAERRGEDPSHCQISLRCHSDGLASAPPLRVTGSDQKGKKSLISADACLVYRATSRLYFTQTSHKNLPPAPLLKNNNNSNNNISPTSRALPPYSKSAKGHCVNIQRTRCRSDEK